MMIREEENIAINESICHTDVQKPSLLLHSCCGPCSTAVIERLADEYSITLFFYNPNITDRTEYELRKAAQLQFLKKYNEEHLNSGEIAFIEGDYDTEAFFDAAKGLEAEAEGGLRCEKCERLRLERTALTAKELGIDTFGTTLTVSPYKNYEIITMIGMELALKNDLTYLDRDFKKKAGYQRSIELSKAYGLYRQHYCGCVFSEREAHEKLKARQEQGTGGKKAK